MMEHRWQLWPKQAEVVCNVAAPNVIFRGGLGTGKTYVGARWTIDRCIMAPPGIKALVVAPTYGLAKTVNQRDMMAALEEAGIAFTSSSSPLDMHVTFAGRKVQFLTGDRPASIVGHTAAVAWHDEPGIQDEEVHRRISDRLREPRVPKLYHLKTGTPEGMGWYHRLEDLRDAAGNLVWTVVAATLFDNGALSEQYMRTQTINWRDSPMARSYLLGEATAITGSVFSAFRREDHTRKLDPRAGIPITAWDFNETHQTTIVASLLPGPSLAVWGEVVSESVDGTPTDEHAARVVKYMEHHTGARPDQRGVIRDMHGNAMVAVIDASGASRKTSAHRTDQQHLEAAGFVVEHDKRNPSIHDSIQNVGYYLRKGLLVFDPVTAKRVTQAVEEHPYAKGSDPPKPKKWASGEPGPQLDHFTDCVRYLCWRTGILGARRGARWV